LNDSDMLKGLTHLYRAAELCPSDANVAMDLGTAMLMLGNIDKAREYAEKTLQIDPGNVLGRRLLETVEDIEKKRERTRRG
jgi:Flp pilus assembly protein TadD